MNARSVAVVRTAVILIGCFRLVEASPRISKPEAVPESIYARFDEAARDACGDRAVKQPCAILSVTSENLIGEVNLYSAVLRVGDGQFDLIRISRIVGEEHPGKAIDGDSAAFFIHGSGQTFVDSFVNSSALQENPGMGLWLAEKGIDVWGIDLRFAFIPADTTNFAFMADWNFGTMVGDVLLATRFARHARRTGGQRFGQVHLIGRSLGASIAYAVANSEAVLAEQDQDIGDLIPIETIYKLSPDDTTGTAVACSNETGHRTAIAAGTFHIDGRSAMAIGEAARTNPDAPSATPGLTNTELALRTACANTFLPPFPYHMAACAVGSNGIPTSGRFSTTRLIIDALANGIPYRSRGVMRDYFGIPCGANEYPYDDHLADIRIPSLYVGAAGGMGESGMYTHTLLGSSDKATIYIQMLPPDQGTSDFGHVESFIANDALSLVWRPVLDWILSHER